MSPPLFVDDAAVVDFDPATVFPYFRDAARNSRASSPEAGHYLKGYAVRPARGPDTEGQLVVPESTEDEDTQP